MRRGASDHVQGTEASVVISTLLDVVRVLEQDARQMTRVAKHFAPDVRLCRNTVFADLLPFRIIGDRCSSARCMTPSIALCRNAAYNVAINPYEPPPPDDESRHRGKSAGDHFENLLRGMAITFAFLAMAAVCMVIFVGSPIAMLTTLAILFGLLLIGMFRAALYPDRHRPTRRGRLEGDADSFADRPRGRRLPRE